MADRTVSVRLRAEVGDFVAEFNIASGVLDAFGKKVDGTSKQVDTSAKKTEDAAKRTSQATRTASVSTSQWLGSLVAGAASLAGPFAAAAGAVTAFGAVAAPSIVKVVTAQKDLSTGWVTLDSRQKIASSHLGAVISQYQSLAKSYEPQALTVFNDAMGDTSVLMQRARPLLDAGAQGMTRFTSQIDSFVTGGTMSKFLSFEATQAGPALDQLGQGFAQTGTLALNLAHDLTPMGMTLLTSANSGLRFLNTIEQVNPHLAEAAVTAFALKAPTQALGKLWTDNASKLSRFAKEGSKAEGFLSKLGKTVGASPGVYIGAALAVGYVAQRLSTMRDSTEQLIDSVRTENRAFGNNAQGHLAAAKSLGTYIAQERAATQATVKGTADIRDRQHITTVYNGEIKKLTEARKQELAAANNINAGEKDLATQYGLTATQANQLATAAGVDLSKGITGSGDAARAAQAKIRAYRQAVIDAQDPTRLIDQALSAAGNSTLALKDRMLALQNSFGALAGPELQAMDATTKTAAAFDQFDAAMKKSKGSMSLTTVAGQNAKTAFVGLLATVEANSVAQYQYDQATKGAAAARANLTNNARALLPVLLAEAGANKTAQRAILDWANSAGVGRTRAQAMASALGLSRNAFLAAAQGAGKSRDEALKLWAAFNKLPAVKNTRLNNNAEERRKAVEDYQAKLDALHGKSVSIRDNAAAAAARVNRVAAAIAALHNKTVSVTTIINTIEIAHRTSQAERADALHGSANGNIFRYANGGENHIAQIARPGDWRLWAEPETGGEAYIPLAPGKRQRSTAILSAVADDFGLSLVKRMAAGGIMSFADGGTTADVGLSSILSDWSQAVKPSTKAQVDAALKSRRTQVNQLANAEDALARARKRGNARDIAAAERRVAAERRDVAAATSKLTDVEARYKFTKQKPATQLGSALGMDIKAKAAFIKNLTTLTDRGFGPLAQQLLAMGDSQAEKIAADAVKLSSSKLKALNSQVTTEQQQATQLANLPAFLTARAAVKAGKGSSWVGLLNATGLTPDVLALAVKSMLSDLNKTTSGRALVADMHAHGYAGGGWIGGVGTGTSDSNLIRASRDEFMVKASSARKYAPWVEAINNDTFGQFVRHLVSGGSGGGRAAASAAPAAGTTIQQTFPTQEMNPAELARYAAREAAWALS